MKSFISTLRYCNNHLQVLGLLPVKSKSATSSKGKNHKIFNSTSKIKLAKKLSNAKKLNHKKSQLILLNKKMKNKTLAKVSGKSTGHQKNDCIKNLQKARKKFHEVVTKNLSQWMEDMEKKKNLFYLSRDFNRNIHNNKCGIHGKVKSDNYCLVKADRVGLSKFSKAYSSIIVVYISAIF